MGTQFPTGSARCLVRYHHGSTRSSFLRTLRSAISVSGQVWSPQSRERRVMLPPPNPMKSIGRFTGGDRNNLRQQRGNNHHRYLWEIVRRGQNPGNAMGWSGMVAKFHETRGDTEPLRSCDKDHGKRGGSGRNHRVCQLASWERATTALPGGHLPQLPRNRAGGAASIYGTDKDITKRVLRKK